MIFWLFFNELDLYFEKCVINLSTKNRDITKNNLIMPR